MENQDNKSKQDWWWSKGLAIFGQSSAWIAGPVLAALLIGQWLDNKYQTKPLYFLSLTIAAFIISSIGIGITGVKYMKQIDAEEKLKKQNNNKSESK